MGRETLTCSRTHQGYFCHTQYGGQVTPRSSSPPQACPASPLSDWKTYSTLEVLWDTIGPLSNLSCVISLLFRTSKQTSIAQEERVSYSQKEFSREDFAVDTQQMQSVGVSSPGPGRFCERGPVFRMLPPCEALPLGFNFKKQQTSAYRKAMANHSDNLTLFLRVNTN